MSTYSLIQSDMGRVFSEVTNRSIDQDLRVALDLLNALARYSRQISLLVNRIIIPSPFDTSKTLFEKTVKWLRENAQDIRNELKDISLVILAGPVEIEPPLIRYRLNEDRHNSFPFDRRFTDWHRLNPPSKVGGEKDVVHQRVTIPKPLLEALGAQVHTRGESISPATTRLHDVTVRFSWSVNTDPEVKEG